MYCPFPRLGLFVGLPRLPSELHRNRLGRLPIKMALLEQNLTDHRDLVQHGLWLHCSGAMNNLVSNASFQWDAM